jgi:hypothetical protein
MLAKDGSRGKRQYMNQSDDRADMARMVIALLQDAAGRLRPRAEPQSPRGRVTVFQK